MVAAKLAGAKTADAKSGATKPGAAKMANDAQVQAPGFVHLHVHSSYSLLEGALSIARLAEMAKKDRQPALALTDTDNMFGALEFSEKMAGYGIQPIVGCALGVDFGDQESRGPAGGETWPRIVLLGRARKRLSQPDAAVVARISRNRAARAPAHKTGLARRRDRRIDRAHRRAQAARSTSPSPAARTRWRWRAAKNCSAGSATASTSNCSATAWRASARSSRP